MATVLARGIEEKAVDGDDHHRRRGTPALEFGRREFLGVFYMERPRIVYREEDSYFFFVVGLKVASRECEDSDFSSSSLVLPWIEAK